MKIKQDNSSLVLPKDFDTLISVVWMQNEQHLVGPMWVMAQVSMSELDKCKKQADVRGMPTHFAITGKTIAFWPRAAEESEIRIHYFPHRKQV